MTVAAALLVSAAIVLARPPGRWWVRRRLGGRDDRVSSSWVAVLGGIGAAVVLPGLPLVSGPRIVLVVTGAAVAWFVVRYVRRARAHDRVTARQGDTLELLGLMAAELRAGVLPHRTLSGLAVDHPVVGAAARAAALGGDVADALRQAAAVPEYNLMKFPSY